MRMFLAVVPPAAIRDHLDTFLESRREAGVDIRWTDPEQFHITLAFLPDVPDRVLEPLADALADAVRERAAFALHLAGGGAFPSPYAARILTARVADDGGHLPRLARVTRATANRSGAAPDGGRFDAHVTVARVRHPIEATRWLRILDTYESPGWVVDDLALVASHLGQGRERRPRYETLATLPLATAAAGRAG
jgi:2'-5' RNA ligase